MSPHSNDYRQLKEKCYIELRNRMCERINNIFENKIFSERTPSELFPLVANSFSARKSITHSSNRLPMFLFVVGMVGCW